MKALVTGASGFIGSHLVDRLLQENYEVTALIRKTSRLRWLENKPIRLTMGDLREPESLVEAVTDQDFIFHLAGVILARNTQEFAETNHHGTENLMEAIMAHNPRVKKTIHVSSLAAGGPTTSDYPLTEEDGSRPISAYGKTKYAGEQTVLSYKDRLNVSVIRPPVVYGPRDKGVLKFFQLIEKHIRVNLGFRNRYASIIHVSDLVEAILLAATRETMSGALYYVGDGGKPRTWIDFQNEIAGVLETWSVKIRVPLALMFLTASLLHGFYLITGKATWINLDKYRELSQEAWLCDGSKIQRELGYTPNVTAPEGIRQTAAWYREMGWLR